MRCGAGARVLRDGLRVEGVRVNVHAATRAEGVRDHKTNGECDRSNQFEVDERLDPDTAELLHVAYAGDANNDGEKDDRGDHHADELDEAVPKRLHGLAEVRPEDPGDGAGHNADKHAKVERLKERLPGLGSDSGGLLVGGHCSPR